MVLRHVSSFYYSALNRYPTFVLSLFLGVCCMMMNVKITDNKEQMLGTQTGPFLSQTNCVVTNSTFPVITQPLCCHGLDCVVTNWTFPVITQPLCCHGLDCCHVFDLSCHQPTTVLSRIELCCHELDFCCQSPTTVLLRIGLCCHELDSSCHNPTTVL